MTTTSPPAVVGARALGLRLGALFGPVVFGVTAAGVALPEISRALGAAPSAVIWVITAHALALGIGTALSGWLADVVGVRTTLIAGALALTLGGAVCALAPSLPVLVVGRLVLAAGSGAMASGALTLAAGVLPERRARVLAVFGATMAVFSAGATLLGGVVTQWLSWRVAVILPVLSLLAVPSSIVAAARGRESVKRVDGLGAALVVVAAAALVLLVQSRTVALPAPVVITCGVLAAAALAAIGARVRAHPDGFVPRVLVTDPAYLLIALVGVGVYGGLFSAMYAVPQLLAAAGWSVLGIGLALLPGAVVGAVLSRVAGRLAASSGAHVLLAAAAVSSAVLLAWAGITDGSALLLITGASLGLAAFAVTQVIATVQLAVRVEPSRRGGATGLLNLVFFVGGAIGAAAAGALATAVPLATALALVATLPLVGGFLVVPLARTTRRPT
jgi:DHA2 family metal-tetracycline-proton antiporter-like MFS transporter